MSTKFSTGDKVRFGKGKAVWTIVGRTGTIGATDCTFAIASEKGATKTLGYEHIGKLTLIEAAQVAASTGADSAVSDHVADMFDAIVSPAEVIAEDAESYVGASVIVAAGTDIETAGFVVGYDHDALTVQVRNAEDDTVITAPMHMVDFVGWESAEFIAAAPEFGPRLVSWLRAEFESTLKREGGKLTGFGVWREPMLCDSPAFRCDRHIDFSTGFSGTFSAYRMPNGALVTVDGAPLPACEYCGTDYATPIATREFSLKFAGEHLDAELVGNDVLGWNVRVHGRNVVHVFRDRLHSAVRYAYVDKASGNIVGGWQNIEHAARLAVRAARVELRKAISLTWETGTVVGAEMLGERDAWMAITDASADGAAEFSNVAPFEWSTGYDGGEYSHEIIFPGADGYNDAVSRHLEFTRATFGPEPVNVPNWDQGKEFRVLLGFGERGRGIGATVTPRPSGAWSVTVTDAQGAPVTVGEIERASGTESLWHTVGFDQVGDLRTRTVLGTFGDPETATRVVARHAGIGADIPGARMNLDHPSSKVPLRGASTRLVKRANGDPVSVALYVDAVGNFHVTLDGATVAKARIVPGESLMVVETANDSRMLGTASTPAEVIERAALRLADMRKGLVPMRSDHPRLSAGSIAYRHDGAEFGTVAEVRSGVVILDSGRSVPRARVWSTRDGGEFVSTPAMMAARKR